VFEHIRDIRDPEHPYSLEQLDVLKLDDVAVDDAGGRVRVVFTPTVMHCSLGECRLEEAPCAHARHRPRAAAAARAGNPGRCPRDPPETPGDPGCRFPAPAAPVIGLCIKARLAKSLPRRFKLDVLVAPGSHSTEVEVNKQLADKERTSAALEMPSLRDLVRRCLEPQE